jgi:hypothetical protein
MPSATATPDFDYAEPKTTIQQQDLEAQAENVINSHIADLDYDQEILDDDEHIIHYSTVIPKQNEKGEEIVVQRSIMPAKRRKLLNLRYVTRLRGLVKLSQTIWAIMLYTAIQFDLDFQDYPAQKITYHMCPFLITFNLIIINGYTAFPHLTIKDGPTRNGMLFTELLLCFIYGFYFLICAPVRAIEIIFFKFSLNSLLLSTFFQGPLTILILYDLFGCFGEWSLVGMRPLGQRVAPKNANTDLPANAYANNGFDLESDNGQTNVLK